METVFNSLENRKEFKIAEDEAALKKFMMLYEGECTIGIHEAIKKYGYTIQRYYILLKLYKEQGLKGLENKKTGPKVNHVRTDEVVNQIVRMRFLDPFKSAGVISQELNQMGYIVSVRSVERTITEFGLQKKHMSLTPKMKKANKKLRLKLQNGKPKQSSSTNREMKEISGSNYPKR